MEAMEKLKESWDAYLRVPLDASARQEKLVQLEIFLRDLIQAAAEADDMPIFSDMRSVSSILAGEFLVDVHRICSESPDEDVTFLRDYLLQGRGGVILRVLNTIGVEHLSCSKELSDLLISLLPLCLKFSQSNGSNGYQGSDVNFAPMEACFCHLPYVAQSPASRKIKFPALTEMAAKLRPPSLPASKLSWSQQQQQTAQKLHTRRVSSAHGRRGDPSSSLSDSDEGEQPPPTPTFHSSKYRRAFTSPLLMQSKTYRMGVYPGMLHPEDGSDEEGAELGAGPSAPALHPMQLCLLLLTVLKELCYDDQPHVENAKSVSAAMLPALAQLVLSFQCEIDAAAPAVIGWGAGDLRLLQRYAVRVVMTMAAQLSLQSNGITLLHGNGALHTLFDLAWTLVQPDQPPLEQLLLGHDVLHGALLLLHCVFANIPLNPSVLNASLKLFHDVLANHGLELIERTLLLLERQAPPSARDGLCSLLQGLAHVISCMKRAKVDYVHMVKCAKLRHQRCDYGHFTHHHHDILGLAASDTDRGLTSSECYGSMDPLEMAPPPDPGGSTLCGVAVICQFLLRLYHRATTKGLRVRVLRCLEEAGLCCCLPPEGVLKALLEDISTQGPAMRAFVLRVLVRALLEQSGGGAESVGDLLMMQSEVCCVCQQEEEEEEAPLPAASLGAEASDSALSESEASLPPHAVPRWRCLRQLQPLVLSEESEISGPAMQGVLRLVGGGSSAMKQELFYCIFLPVLQATKLRFLSGAASADGGGEGPTLDVIHSCLSALPVLLQCRRACRIFLAFGGVEQLGRLVCVPALRTCVLRLFQVLIILEDRQQVALNRGPTLSPPPQSHPPSTVLREYLRMFYSHLGFDVPKSGYNSSESENDLNFDRELAAKGPSTPTSELTGEALGQCCDLWDTTDELFSQSKSFAARFLLTEGVGVCQSTLRGALGALVRTPSKDPLPPTLLFSRDRSTELGCWLALTQATLSLALGCAAQQASRDCHEESLTIAQLVAEVKLCLAQSSLVKTEKADSLLKLVCDLLLQTATRHRSASDVVFTHTFSIMHLRGDDPVFDRDLLEASDPNNDTETCFTEQGYEADSEITDFPEEVNRSTRRSKNVRRKRSPTKVAHSVILYPELCRLVVELLVAYKEGVAKRESNPCSENSVVIHILLRLLSLAKVSDENAQALYSQNLISVIIEGFKPVLISQEPEDQVEKRMVLHLFETISRQAFSAKELREFLRLFKEDGCCYDGLLSTLIALSQTAQCQPSHVVQFPVCTSPSLGADLELSVRSVEDDILTCSIRPVVSSLFDSREKEVTQESSEASLDVATSSLESSGIASQSFRGCSSKSPASVAPLQILLRDCSMWPTNQRGFSVAFWLRIDAPSDKSGSDDRKIPISQILAESSLQASGSPGVTGLPAKLCASLRRSLASCHWSDNCLHLISIGNQELMLEVWTDPDYPNLIYRLVTHSRGEEAVLNEASVATRLVHDKWQHLSIAFSEKPMDSRSLASVTSTVDGCYQKEICMEYSMNNVMTPAAPTRESHLFLGHSVDHIQKLTSSWQMGNLMLFKDSKMTKHTSFHLFALGPDCLTLGQCDSSELKAEYCHHISEELAQNAGISHDVFTGNHTIYLQHLRENLVLVYNPKTASSFSLYHRPSPYRQLSSPATPPSMKTLLQPPSPRVPAGPLMLQPTVVPASTKLLLNGVACRAQRGLATAVDQNGGIGLFLFLFAKVVETCACERQQADSLQLLMSLVQREPRHATDFRAMSGYGMLAKVLRSPRCMLGQSLLRVLLEAALTRSMLLQRPALHPLALPPGSFQLDHQSHALIRNVHLITDVLLAWRSWEHAQAGVWELVFSALEVLVREDHPQQKFNVRQLYNAGVVRLLLNICLERLQDACPPLPLAITQSMVKIIRQLVGTPPDVHSIISLCDFLLLMHPAASTYVSHTPTDFYFTHTWALHKSQVSSHKNSSTQPTDNTQRKSPLTPIQSANGLSSGISSSGKSSSGEEMENSAHCVEPLTNGCSFESLKRSESDPSGMQHIFLPPEPSTTDCPRHRSHSLPDSMHDEGEELPAPPLPILSINGCTPPEKAPPTVNGDSTPSLTKPEFQLKLDPFPGEKHRSSSELSPMGTGASLGSSDDWVMYPNPASMKSIPVKAHELKAALHEGEDEGPEALVTGVLGLLAQALVLIPSRDLPLVHGTVLSWERLVILAHHKSPAVRAAVIRLLDVFLHKASTEQLVTLQRGECCHLLATQLHRHSASPEIAEACLTLLVGKPQTLDEEVELQLLNEVTPLQEQSLAPLLALLRPSLSDPALCHHLLSTLHRLFSQTPCLFQAMLSLGLVETLCNLLHEINTLPPGGEGILLVLLDIQLFFRTLGQRLFSTSGSTCWQHLEDALTLLLALEDCQTHLYGASSVQMCNVREVICVFLQSILDHLSERLETPANLQLRTTSTISSAVGSILQWRAPSSDPSDLGTASDDLELSFERHSFEQENKPSQPVTSRLFKSRSGTGIPEGDPSLSLGFINFPKFRRSVSATIGEYSSRLGITGALNSAGFGSGQTVNGGHHSESDSHPDVLAPSGFLGGTTSSNSKKDTALTQAELLDRFKKLVTMATDFVVFLGHPLQKGHECHDSDSSDDSSDSLGRQMTLEKTLLRFLLRALVSSLEKGFFQRKTISAAIMWQAKDTLKVQFSRLLVHQLAPEQPLCQREHALSTIANEAKCDALLKFTMGVNNAGQKVVFFLYQLLSKHTTSLSRGLRNEVNEVMNHLSTCGFSPLRLGMSLSKEFLMQMDEEMRGWASGFRKEKAKWLQRQQLARQRVMQRLQPLGRQVSEAAMMVTQQVNNMQSQQRRTFLDHVKRVMSEWLQVKKHWQALLQQLAHERGLWHCAKSHPRSWQLDPTEGPSRMRKRLQPCHLSIASRFLRPEQCYKLDAEKVDPPLAYLFEDEDLGSDSAALIYKLHTSQNIQYTCMCTNVTPSSETPGALLVGQNDLYFVADDAIKDASYTQVLLGNRDILFMTLAQEDIREIHRRWYQLQDHGLEIFLTNGKTCLLAFDTTKERDELHSQLLLLDLPNRLPSENLAAVVVMWQEGHMTNFEYLTYLNKMAGRTFNDLMQYPVFPFVLASYGQTLALDHPESFRILGKPIAVQHKEREQKYRDHYQWLANEHNRQVDLDPIDQKEYRPEPYHYGSHYSNSGTVLHFLVRLPPFTQMFLHYQDQNFDIPDRTFHSMQTAWRLSSFQSSVKELIPEFYFLPEFLRNNEGFAFGNCQTGEPVDHVKLPGWSKGDARLFTLIHAQALESDYVTQHLPSWIDLVFGYKQTGRSAIEAFNVFHPATYFGVDVDSIEDPVRRSAIKTMIKTYGQTPKQLFRNPHPQVGAWLKADRLKESRDREPLGDLVQGLKWGTYVGSPDHSPPVLTWLQNHGSTVCSLVALPTGEVFGLGPQSSLLVIYSKEKGLTSVRSVNVEWAAILSWGHPDAIIRVRNKKDFPAVNFLHWTTPDAITCCASVPDCRLLFFGSSSGIISVISTKFNANKQSHLQVFGRKTHLYGHTADVSSLWVCKPFSVMVSSSMDTTCIIWDLNRLTYVRSITEHQSAVVTVVVSETSGDIASVSHQESGSVLWLHSINAQPITSVSCPELIHCLAFSNLPEGRTVNVLAGGLSSGAVRLWSTWDLTVVRDIAEDMFKHPMLSLCFSHDAKRLFAANADGRVAVWSSNSCGRLKDVVFIPFL